eukprot:1385799-Amphidinium_carterae.1
MMHTATNDWHLGPNDVGYLLLYPLFIGNHHISIIRDPSSAETQYLLCDSCHPEPYVMSEELMRRVVLHCIGEHSFARHMAWRVSRM